MKTPGISVDIIIVRDGKILLGFMTKQWQYEGKQVYGLPGRDIRFGEKIGEAVKRNIKEEFNCTVTKYKIIAVNANYALGNHYIGIGVVAEMDGEPKVLLKEDWEKWEWFDTKELPDNFFPAARNVLESYLQNRVTVSE